MSTIENAFVILVMLGGISALLLIAGALADGIEWWLSRK